MPVQRKIFRIEEMSREEEQIPSPPIGEIGDWPGHAEIMAELRALRALITAKDTANPGQTAIQRNPAGEARKLKIELDVIGEAISKTKSEIITLQDQGFDGDRVARVAHELVAVVCGAEQATERILQATEAIDETANSLCASLKSEYERGLARDIQDRVTEIFEACNFHDLTGQRISKVAATMKLVEDHIARMTEIWSVIERFGADATWPEASGSQAANLLHGPELDGDLGHSSQDEIDALFD